MPTTFKYIKALIPIRLFNGALWMEEEDINRITEEMFNTTEVQNAITNAQLIEVNNNDLPVDVVSPTLKFKGDWDSSDGQLPIGRRIGDVYRVIGAGTVGGIEVGVGQIVFFRSLSSFDFLGFTDEELTASQYIFKTTGDWAPTGVLADAVAIGAVDGVLQVSGSNQVLVPNPVLLGLGSVAIAHSGSGILTTGTGTVWASVVMPQIEVTDNVQEFGIYFLNETAEPEDFAIIATGGFPTNSTYGGVVTVTASGFTSYAIVNNVVGNAVTGVFAAPLVAGDVIYIGFDRTNSRLLVQKGTDSILVGASLVFSGFPSGESFQVCSYISFASSTVEFQANALEFDLSVATGGKSPIQAVGPVVAPAGAEDGKEYRVTANGIYNGYRLETNDVVKFFNGIDDVVITRVPKISKDDIPPGVLSVGYDVDTQQLSITRLFANGRTDNVSTLIDTSGGGGSGYACVIDVTPQNPGENVGTKVRPDDGIVLTSCVSGTADIRVHVLAITGSATLLPEVSVNGNAVTNLTVSEARNLWEGYYDLTISGDTMITVQHIEGASHTCSVVYEAPPVVTSAVFLGAYPAVGQTQYKAGSAVNVQVTSSTPFLEVEYQDLSSTATTFFTEAFTATTTKTSGVTIANRGNLTQNLPARVRIRNATGTWSQWYDSNLAGTTDHVHTVALNNTQPSAVLGPVDYRVVSKLALKGVDEADLPVAYTNVDTVAFTSTGNQISFDAPTTVSDQVVTIAAGGAGIYNIATNNVTATVTRTANNASATFSTVVWIADVIPTIKITTPAARLRSGVTTQNHTITIKAQDNTQRTLGLTDLTADKGSWVGSWVTANNGATWTRTLQIADATPKGTGTFSALTGLKTLALAPIEVITEGETYTVGGFVQRVVVFSPAFSREVDIGTYVSDITKVQATNLSKGDPGTHNTILELPMSLADQPGAGSTPSKYAITSPLGVLNSQGRYLYNRDIDNVNNNTGGTAQWEIEEVV